MRQTLIQPSDVRESRRLSGSANVLNVSVAVFVAIAALSLVLLVNAYASKWKVPLTLCDSKPCKMYGQLLQGSLSLNEAPCDDFYKYVCGGWNVNNRVGDVITRSILRSVLGRTTAKRCTGC